MDRLGVRMSLVGLDDGMPVGVAQAIGPPKAVDLGDRSDAVVAYVPHPDKVSCPAAGEIENQVVLVPIEQAERMVTDGVDVVHGVRALLYTFDVDRISFGRLVANLEQVSAV